MNHPSSVQVDIRHTSQRRFHLLTRILLISCTVILALVSTANVAFSQESSVTAEAIGTANVRTGPGIEFDLVGTIASGTQYPIVGRSSRFPWLLIELPNSLGWVFTDLVTVRGDLNTVPFSDFIGGRTVVPGTAAPTSEAGGTGGGNEPVIVSTAAPGVTLTPTQPPADAGPTADPTQVFAEALDQANVRYGPDINAPLVGRIRAGELYPVTQRHLLYPWIEIFFPNSPSQFGWVYYNGPDDATVRISGDLNTVPETSLLDFGYVTLTPTPPLVVTAFPPVGFPVEIFPDSPIVGLTEDINLYLLEQGFAPGTTTQGSVFLHDLNTQEAMSINAGVAYSGVSLMKIPVMVAWMRKFDTLPTAEQALDITNMMVCSENSASNRVLTALGDGDAAAGVTYVTETMQLLGLENTFISRTFFVGETPEQLQTQTAQITPVTTEADQISAVPDPYNQTTAEDMGWLLAGINRCEQGDPTWSEPLDGAITDTECRKIIATMQANNIGALFEAGVPEGVFIAHKHGWSDETHADAAIVRTDVSNYVLVMMLRGETWLEQDDSFPVFAEVSRRAHNVFNPINPLAEPETQPVPATCTPPDAVVEMLRTSALDTLQ
jgi:uncharacterized protein YraI/beta-lactamase class A